MAMTTTGQPLPRFKFGNVQIRLEQAFVGALLTVDLAMMLWSIFRLLREPPAFLWIPPSMLLGWATAEFGSTLFHIWGDRNYFQDVPLFSVYNNVYRRHHFDPEEMARNPWLTNATWVAGIALMPFFILPVLISRFPVALALAIQTTIAALLTAEQAHRFAHCLPEQAPSYAQLLQKWHLWIDPVLHQKHHSGENDTDFSIMAGWSNHFGAFAEKGAVWQQRASAMLTVAVTYLVLGLTAQLLFGRLISF